LAGKYSVVGGMGKVEMGPHGKKLDICQCEWVVICGCGASVFTWLDKKEKCDCDHIGCGGMVGVLTGLCHVGNVQEKGDAWVWVLHSVVVGQFCHMQPVVGAGGNQLCHGGQGMGLGPPDQGTFGQCPVRKLSPSQHGWVIQWQICGQCSISGQRLGGWELDWPCLQASRSGSMPWVVQKCVHPCHWELAAWAWVGMTLVWIASCTALRSHWNTLPVAVSIVTKIAAVGK